MSAFLILLHYSRGLLKGGLPRELERIHSFLSKGLAETHALWADVEMGYRWVHRAAHLLTNDEKQRACQVRQNYEALLAEMEQAPETSETLTTMLTTFRPRHGKLLAWPLSLLRCC